MQGRVTARWAWVGWVALLVGCAPEPVPAPVGINRTITASCAGASSTCAFGGESHFLVCEEIDVDDVRVNCVDQHACKTPIEHILACCACDNARFCDLPGLDECPDGPWDFGCHAVTVEGREAPFDCRDLDRCDPMKVVERAACGACDRRYDAPRSTPCPSADD